MSRPPSAAVDAEKTKMSAPPKANATDRSAHIAHSAGSDVPRLLRFVREMGAVIVGTPCFMIMIFCELEVCESGPFLRRF